jgi:cytochrome c-type biogenesis protein CcmH
MPKPFLVLFVFACLSLTGGLSPISTAVAEDNEPLVFASEAQEERYKHLIVELRCLVCQNQNLADSDAELAQDLRKEIYDMMQAGKSNDEIKTFMVDRYGDFVLYRPPVQGNTVALWVLPVLILAGGAVGVALTIRRRNRQIAAAKAAQASQEEKS